MDASTSVTVRYWAGAKAAAGVAHEQVDAADLSALRTQLVAEHPALEPVLKVASVLVDGRAGREDEPLPSGAVVEVLPPFAGG